MHPAPATASPAPEHRSNPGLTWFGRAEAWLDARGKGAWIAAMVIGFILFWPIGLALLFYMIWSNRMFSGNCRGRRTAHRAYPMSRASSGNTAFDAYRAETLRRLEEEQEAFQAFLDRLRDAKDKAEFDAFMEERTKSRDTETASDPGKPEGNGEGGTDTPRPTPEPA